MVYWLSLLHNFIQQSLNSDYAQVQTMFAAFWRFVMVRIFDNGPGWKQDVNAFCRSTIPQKQFIVIHLIDLTVPGGFHPNFLSSLIEFKIS